MVPCHYGHVVDERTRTDKKEYYISVDCNMKKGGTIHIYPARELAKWCSNQPSRSTKVKTRCVEVHWNKDIKGKRTIQLDEDIWECIKKWKENTHAGK
jgi:hypothetical protein